MKVGIIIIVILVAVSFIIAVLLTKGSDFSGLRLPSGATKDVALIKVYGAIATEQEFSLFGAQGASSDELVKQIEKAATDDVDAVYIEINSPGGTVVASEEIANAIKKVEKPTVAFIREVGASGGYWVASATDFIIADPYSITGSIGVIGSYLEFAELLEHYNITYRPLTGGKYKDIGSPFKELTGEEQAILQQRIDIIHQGFISEIAENRKLPYEFVKNVSTGVFYLGVQAKEIGLVDQIGSKDDVEKYLKELLNATEINFIEYAKAPSFFDALAGVMSQSFFYMGKGLGQGLVETGNTGILAQ